MNIQDKINLLEAEIVRLRAALEDEWLMNHSEHCTNMENCTSFGGQRQCQHERPEVLKE